MEFRKQPDIRIAERVLPKPLYKTLLTIFKYPIEGCMLVGGTALAGFYFAHRRSDDLDLFTQDQSAFQITLKTVLSLESTGLKFLAKRESRFFCKFNCEFEGHNFTIDIVEDKNAYTLGHPLQLQNGIVVAPLEIIIAQKISTLLSRCSEKDLYDLCFLFEQFEDLTVEDLIRLGQKVDTGLGAESLIMSMSTTDIMEEKCDFSLNSNILNKMIFDQIKEFKYELILQLRNYAKSQPTPPLGHLVKKIKKWMK